MTAALLFFAAVLGGAIAALAGFGIGSILTPLLALSVGTKQAVVAVSIPHLVATAIRFWNLRHKVDRNLLKNFGIASAAGGLLGGLVGNQGGVRSAAMLGFNLDAKTFVATATAIALIVDGARMPVYFFTSPETVQRLGAWIAIMAAGVASGTLLGGKVLARIP